MSDYTISIYQLQQNNFDFGLTDYPIFNEEYRPILNNAILEFYRFYEIGFQNPEMFKERLNARMNRIMRDKFNALYEAKAIEFNPLYNIEITETLDRTVNSTGQNTSNYNENTKTNQYNSEFPNENMLVDELGESVYIDNAQKLKNAVDGNGTSDSITDGSEQYVRTTKGSSAGLPFSRAMLQLKDFYESYNLDKQVIDSLKDLFIQVY